MNKILTAYLTCALWSSTQENGKPFDENFKTENFSPEAIQSAEKDIQDFLSLLEAENILWEEEITESRFGKEF